MASLATKRKRLDDSPDKDTPAPPTHTAATLDDDDDDEDDLVFQRRPKKAASATPAPTQPRQTVDLTTPLGPIIPDPPGTTPPEDDDEGSVGHADEDEADDAEIEALIKCDQVATRLRECLGGVDEGRCAAVEAGDLKGALATKEDVVSACGPAAASLKPYQLVGINFLLLHTRSGAGGAILAVCQTDLYLVYGDCVVTDLSTDWHVAGALSPSRMQDEMGLGKTAQTISFLGTALGLSTCMFDCQ